MKIGDAIRALAVVLVTSTALTATAQEGADLYKTHCAPCHDGGVPRAPRLEALRTMSPEAVLHSLETGTMRLLGVIRTVKERQLISEFVSGKAFGSDPGTSQPSIGSCTAEAADLTNPFDGPRWNGWGVDLSNSRFQPTDMAGLTAEQVPKLKLKWAFGFANDIMAYAQPTIVGGRLYVGSARGKVYALDAKTGCTYWSFRAESAVRSAITIGLDYAAYFGDLRGNVYSVNAQDGELIWKTRVDNHPDARITGAPQLHGQRLYVPVSSFEEGTAVDPSYECCSFRGSVVALNSKTGKQIWKTYTIAKPARKAEKNKVGTQLWGPSGAAVWSAPTIDPKGNALYVATGDNYSDPPNETSDAILALQLDTGKILWARQMTVGDAFNGACFMPDTTNCPESNGPDFDFGSSSILVSLSNGKRALLVGQKSGIVHALDPDRNGEILWQVRVGKGGIQGGVQWGSAADDQKMYVAVSDVGFDVVEHPELGAEVQYDPIVGGGLFALRIATGEKVWYSPPPGCGDRRPCSPAQSAAVTMMPGMVFSGSIDGHLRAYSSRDGSIVWDVDTVREYETINGLTARGGSLDAAGPTVVDGMLYVNSGYGFWGGIPGNVLLAFSVGGK